MPKKKKAAQVLPNYFKKKEIELFKQGQHCHLYQKLGAHHKRINKQDGVYFAVWAPHARAVSVFGDFNQWKKRGYSLRVRDDGSGIWEGFVAGARKGDRYKYRIRSHLFRWSTDKCDPFAFHTQIPPETASCIWSLNYSWQDQKWMRQRKRKNDYKAPLSIYEVHLGSWRQKNTESERFLSYRDMVKELVPYVKKMGFTHVEFLPVMEHPYYGSWGYQTLGYFTPSARYGTPQDFMHLIDAFHQNGIGVFLDWVPSHFPTDNHGLANFDGTRLFETNEIHPDWQSCIFNVGSLQVKDFLISNALFWLKKFHIDGLRVDAVASMLYLDYSRGDRWNPNFFGGVQNLDSIAFLRELNQTVKEQFPDVLMMAEESTTWQNVSRPTDQGGLHFDMKWNLGWMHDTLSFFAQPVENRKYYVGQLMHCLTYVFYENFLLTLSHDEVVHLKKSLISKMPGDDKEKFTHLKCLYGFMYAHPGKKLLFMGGELAQWTEWNHESSLSWELLEQPRHLGIQTLIRDLNHLYKKYRALYQTDFTDRGFAWADISKQNDGVLSFVRTTPNKKEEILVVFNYKQTYRRGFSLGVPSNGTYEELLNTDHISYGGKGRINTGDLKTVKAKRSSFPEKLILKLPPLSVIFLKRK